MTPASPDDSGAPPPGHRSGVGRVVRFRQLDGAAEMAAAAALIAEVFGATEGPPLPADLLTAIRCAGGFVGAALIGGDEAAGHAAAGDEAPGRPAAGDEAPGRPAAGDEAAGQATAGQMAGAALPGGVLVGVAVAFGEVPAPVAADDAPHPAGLHSHVAAVHPAARGLRIGQRLKWYQRDWALRRGIDVIHWTFDPLVRRNAVLNLNRLGAVGVAYLRNLYGAIPDALNAGMESDRLLVRWDLNGPRAVAALRSLGEDSPTIAAPGRSGTGAPVTAGRPGAGPDAPVSATPTAGRHDSPVTAAHHLPGRAEVAIDTPEDVEALLARDPDAAVGWRRRQRAALEPLLHQGFLVTGIAVDGHYQLEPS